MNSAIASPECYHGGAFFEAIGNRFGDLPRRHDIINADVLDAWYPPCPAAVQAIRDHLEWIMGTSPPNHAEGLVETLAEVRGVAKEHILAAGGSSPLIFSAFRQWLTPSSRVLVLDPMYGEYVHVLQKVVGCRVERFRLLREDGYVFDPLRFAKTLATGFDLVAWVNPNSPTGRHVVPGEVQDIIRQCPPSTRFWIDETYVEYAGKGQSLEAFAASSNNVVVVKSMSKVYGLSGLRVGYLCGPRRHIDSLRGLQPPWSVSLPAQIAAVHALQATGYYAQRYRETHVLRAQLAAGLRAIGMRDIIPGIANFILFHLPDGGPDGESMIRLCRNRGLFIRDASEMGTAMGDRALRIAVKDARTNQRMLEIMEDALVAATGKEPCHA